MLNVKIVLQLHDREFIKNKWYFKKKKKKQEDLVIAVRHVDKKKIFSELLVKYIFQYKLEYTKFIPKVSSSSFFQIKYVYILSSDTVHILIHLLTPFLAFCSSRLCPLHTTFARSASLSPFRRSSHSPSSFIRLHLRGIFIQVHILQDAQGS